MQSFNSPLHKGQRDAYTISRDTTIPLMFIVWRHGYHPTAPRTTGRPVPQPSVNFSEESTRVGRVEMNVLTRGIIVAFGAVALAVAALFAGTASAQAATSLQTSAAITMNVHNGTGHPIEVTVFPSGGSPTRKNLDVGETWKVTGTYGAMNELSMRTPGDPNYQFLGHFDYSNGQFHLFEVVHSSVAYFVQAKGPAAGFYFS